MHFFSIGTDAIDVISYVILSKKCMLEYGCFLEGYKDFYNITREAFNSKFCLTLMLSIYRNSFNQYKQDAYQSNLTINKN